MKIFAPIRNSAHIAMLEEAGADEYYCGFNDDRWIRTFGNSIEMNRRSACGNAANFASLDDLKNAVKVTHQYNKKILLALNHHQFTKSEIGYVCEMIDVFSSIGGDGVILADLAAIDYAVRKKLYVAVSTDAHIYNVETALFYARRGANRLILSRDIPIDTIGKIKGAVGTVEIESFMINGPCKFSDSLCLGLHSTEYGAFCRFLNGCDWVFPDKENLKQTKSAYSFFLNEYMKSACGLCAIWKLMDLHVDACKVVGRVLPPERIVKEVRLIHENIRIAATCSSQEEFLSKMIRPKIQTCRTANNCLYPDTQYLLH